ncbi:MAG: DUF1778 domain-containing protein [Propionibacteriaceae bacterium]|jgi:uncharacterized protein (DUF1778 family)|nr:DUF1778 domain-containing protein [Propionibacteriaceae bacterium]
MAQPLRTRRFETRLDAETDNLISEAAEILGESRSTFVTRAAKQAATKVVSPMDQMTRRQALAVLTEGMTEAEIASCPLLKVLAS